MDKNFSYNSSKLLVEELIAIYLTIRNKMPNTAFPAEGNLESIPNEGSVIKTSCTNLAKINNHLASSTNKIFNDEELNKLSNGLAQQILNLFGFPKIPKEKIIDLTASEEKQIWDNIVAEKRYKQGTMPRSNNLNTLRDVICNHLDLILNCFPSIASHEILAKRILDKFIQSVAKDGKINGVKLGWELDDSMSNTLQQSVINKLYLIGSFQPESSHTSDNDSSSQYSSSGNITPTEDKDSTAMIRKTLGDITLESDEYNSENDPNYTPPTSDEEVASSRSPYQTRQQSNLTEDNRTQHRFKK